LRSGCGLKRGQQIQWIDDFEQKIAKIAKKLLPTAAMRVNEEPTSGAWPLELRLRLGLWVVAVALLGVCSWGCESVGREERRLDVTTS
jgi:hypothetical protein